MDPTDHTVPVLMGFIWGRGYRWRMKADLGQLNSNFSLTNLHGGALLFVRYLTDAAAFKKIWAYYTVKSLYAYIYLFFI